MTTLLPLVIMVVALFAGVPIAFAMAGAGIVGVGLVTGNWQAAMGIVGTSVYRGASDYVLTTIPMFILMAYLILVSGMARNLYDAAATWFSHIPGGLAMATIFAGAVFGALCGASTAAASVLSEVALPNMRAHKYRDDLSTGAICLAATLSVLIPPSLALIVYGLMTETSINKLLIAGIFPGILLALVIIVIVSIWVRLQPAAAPTTYLSSWSDRRTSFVSTWPAALLIIAMLAMLYSGAVTASEVAALGAILAAVIGLSTRRLSMAGLLVALRSTVRTAAMIFSIFIGATVFGYYVTMTKLPQALVGYITELNLNRWVVVAAIIVAYFVISMFMDEVPLIIIMLPFTFPVILALGFDPIWYGVMTVMMMIMGLIFPPVGMTAMVVSGASRVELMTVYRGASVLLVGVFITTALLMVFPDIATFLPSRIG